MPNYLFSIKEDAYGPDEERYPHFWETSITAARWPEPLVDHDLDGDWEL